MPKKSQLLFAMNHHLQGHQASDNYYSPPRSHGRPHYFYDNSKPHYHSTNILLHHSGSVASRYKTETTVHNHILDYTCNTEPASIYVAHGSALRNETSSTPESCLDVLPSHPNEATNLKPVPASYYTLPGRALRNNTSFRPESCLAALPSQPNEATNHNQVQAHYYTADGRALRNNTSFRPESCLAALPSQANEATNQQSSEGSLLHC